MLTFVEAVKDLRAALRTVERVLIAQAQAECAHAHILHYDGFESFGTYHPARCCSDCGLYETGSWWSYSGSFWHVDDYTAPCLDNAPGRIITKARCHELQAVRLS